MKLEALVLEFEERTSSRNYLQSRALQMPRHDLFDIFYPHNFP